MQVAVIVFYSIGVGVVSKFNLLVRRLWYNVHHLSGYTLLLRHKANRTKTLIGVTAPIRHRFSTVVILLSTYNADSIRNYGGLFKVSVTKAI